MLRSKACSVLSGRIILGFVRQRERLRKLGLPIKRLLVPLYACGLPLDENVVETIVRRTEKASAAFIKELLRRAAQFYIKNGSNGRLQLTDLNAALEEMLFAGGSLMPDYFALRTYPRRPCSDPYQC